MKEKLKCAVSDLLEKRELSILPGLFSLLLSLQPPTLAYISGGSRRLVLMTVCFGLICVVLLVFIIMKLITITAERDLLKSYKNTVEEFNHTINSLQDNYTDLMIDKDQLKNNVNSLTLVSNSTFKDLTAEKSQLETRAKDLTAEKSQLQNSFNSLSQKKLKLETRVKDLTAEKSQLETRAKDLTAEKSQLETRAKELTAEKSQLQNSFNSLSEKKLELETRVNDLTSEKGQLETRAKELTAEKSQLQNSFNSLSQKKLELETRVNDLTSEKSQLEGSVDSLNQEKLELESKVTSLSEELKKTSKQGYLWGPDDLFISSELKSWSESRQYCRDRGADLIIINTEEKQRHISSFIKETVWIGLSEIENKGKMTWVDNSPLNQTFWYEEPNNAGGDEDCVELIHSAMILNNWNDLPCSEKRKGICEK